MQNETRVGLAYGCTFVAAFAVALACIGNRMVQVPDTRSTFNVPSAEERMANLLDAVRKIESSHDDGAWNKKEDARGGLQIRAVYVVDVNRILGRNKYTHNDAFIPERANEMFKIYCRHYAQKYIENGMRWEEAFARAHNGGPAGPGKPATVVYWRGIEDELNK